MAVLVELLLSTQTVISSGAKKSGRHALDLSGSVEVTFVYRVVSLAGDGSPLNAIHE